MSVIEMFTARLTARKIGQDSHGNAYFEGRRVLPVYNRKRRFVITSGAQEATKVPPEWHAWLHHTTEAPLDEARRHPWQKPHEPNLTGTAQAWRPKGHDYSGGQRRITTGDYEAWSPGGARESTSPEGARGSTSPEGVREITSPEGARASNPPVGAQVSTSPVGAGASASSEGARVSISPDGAHGGTTP